MTDEIYDEVSVISDTPEDWANVIESLKARDGEEGFRNIVIMAGRQSGKSMMMVELLRREVDRMRAEAAAIDPFVEERFSEALDAMIILQAGTGTIISPKSILEAVKTRSVEEAVDRFKKILDPNTPHNMMAILDEFAGPEFPGLLSREDLQASIPDMKERRYLLEDDDPGNKTPKAFRSGHKVRTRKTKR